MAVVGTGGNSRFLFSTDCSSWNGQQVAWASHGPPTGDPLVSLLTLVVELMQLWEELMVRFPLKVDGIPRIISQLTLVFCSLCRVCAATTRGGSRWHRGHGPGFLRAPRSWNSFLTLYDSGSVPVVVHGHVTWPRCMVQLHERALQGPFTDGVRRFDAPTKMDWNPRHCLCGLCGRRDNRGAGKIEVQCQLYGTSGGRCFIRAESNTMCGSDDERMFSFSWNDQIWSCDPDFRE